jgi:hypothetical protein
MRRFAFPALVIVVGIVILADLLVANASLGTVATIAIDAAIVVAAGAALAAGASLALRRGRDLWERRGDPVGAIAVLVGIGAILAAGLRPGATGAADPAVGWLIGALVIPLGATLFALLFATTLGAMRRSLTGSHNREATVLVGAAVVVLALLLPIGGGAGDWLSAAASWVLVVPVGAVLRGILIGVAILAAVVGGRTVLGIGPSDD